MPFPMTDAAAPGGLREEFRQLFRQYGELKEFPAQTRLLRQEEPIDPILLIESGLVKLTRTNAKGREVVVDLRFPGMMLGAASAVSDNPAAASAATLEASRIYCLPTNLFWRQMEMNPAFEKEVTRALGQNYYEQTLRQAQLTLLSAPGRVAALLLYFAPAAAPNRNGEIRLQLPMDQTDAAGLLGMSRETYNRTLGKLTRDGLIRRSNGWIYIRSLEPLRREAGE